VQLPYLFTPLTDTLAILVGSLVLGVLQIITGMAISVVYKCRNGDWVDALWNEITWWIVLAGAALAILGVGNVAGYPVVLYVGLLMLVYGSTRNAKGFGKVTALIGAVYNGVSGYFSDILSYARLMALMLAGAVIAQVFNTLGSVTGNVILFVIISMIGNALNLALNLFGCYVHDLRLQCLEFFGKFYKDGGIPFRPLNIQTRYFNIADYKEEL
jgi:V/A-type H+-transporting ATPase subunit I